MKKIFRTTLMFMTMGIMIAPFISCSDDDGNKEVVDKDEITDEIYYDIVADALLRDSIINGDTVKIPSIGTMEKMNSYYYVIDTITDAEDFFNSYCVPNISNFAVTKVGSKQIADFGEYGKITYEPTGDIPALATITLDLKGMIGPTAIGFLLRKDMPGNARTPYEAGDVVKDPYGYYWLCVEECGGSETGRLVCFTNNVNSSYVEDHYKKAWFWKDAKVGNSVCQLADRRAYLGYQKMLKDEYNALQDAKKFLEGKGSNACQTVTVINRSCNSNCDDLYQIGKVDDTSDTHYHWKCARHLYKLTYNYFRTRGANKTDFGSYYTYHEFDGDGRIRNIEFVGGNAGVYKEFSTNELTGWTKVFPYD